jgi:hypothetical protein
MYDFLAFTQKVRVGYVMLTTTRKTKVDLGKGQSYVGFSRIGTVCTMSSDLYIICA